MTQLELTTTAATPCLVEQEERRSSFPIEATRCVWFLLSNFHILKLAAIHHYPQCAELVDDVLHAIGVEFGERGFYLR